MNDLYITSYAINLWGVQWKMPVESYSYLIWSCNIHTIAIKVLEESYILLLDSSSLSHEKIAHSIWPCSITLIKLSLSQKFWLNFILLHCLHFTFTFILIKLSLSQKFRFYFILLHCPHFCQTFSSNLQIECLILSSPRKKVSWTICADIKLSNPFSADIYLVVYWNKTFPHNHISGLKLLK